MVPLWSEIWNRYLAWKKATIHWQFFSHVTLFWVWITVFSPCYLSLRGVPCQVVLSSCDIFDWKKKRNANSDKFWPHCAGALSSLSIFCWCYTCIHVSFSVHIWDKKIYFGTGVQVFFSKQNFEVVFFLEYCFSIDLLYYFVRKVFNRFPFISVSLPLCCRC